MKKNNNVVIYLTDDKEKDSAVIKFCKDNKLNIVKTFKPHMDESERYWNTALFDMCFEMFELKKKYDIKNIITYDLENLFWCLYDQIAISLMLFDSGVEMFTLKEGNICDSKIMEIKLHIKDENIKNLKKYWIKEDKVEEEKENEKSKKN